jgi:shikimate kinase
MRMERVVVIGCGGSGKTTLAKHLAIILDLPVTHLDAVYYDEAWQPLAHDEFAASQREIVSADRWIIEGNYASTPGRTHTARTSRAAMKARNASVGITSGAGENTRRFTYSCPSGTRSATSGAQRSASVGRLGRDWWWVAILRPRDAHWG